MFGNQTPPHRHSVNTYCDGPPDHLELILRCCLYFRVLTSIHDKMRTTHDISVRFFGIDWQHMFRISYNLGELVTEMAELARERDEHFQVWQSSC